MTDLGLFNFGLSEQADEHLVHLVSQVGTGAIPVVGDECPGVFWVIGRIISVSYTHLDVYKRQPRHSGVAIFFQIAVQAHRHRIGIVGGDEHLVAIV